MPRNAMQKKKKRNTMMLSIKLRTMEATTVYSHFFFAYADISVIWEGHVLSNFLL